MSAAHHIEWLSLIESTGPFLSVAVLDEAMPTGLDALPATNRKRIRSAYEEWCDAEDQDDPRLEDFHREWIRLVIEELLEYDASVLKSGEEIPDSLSYQHPQTSDSILPDFAVLSDDKAKLLIATYPPDTDMESPLDGEPWAASPLERMTLMCRSKEVPIGLVTNGERWTLVGALPDGTTSFGSWFARIWLQEPITLQAFQTLLGVRRCFGSDSESLEALFTESLKHRDEVTDTLGEQVRRAIEVLVQALDRADLDRDRQLLKDVSPKDLYDAGLTVMMRLVFILCAEERKLLLLGEPTYDQYYAVSTLRSQLLADAEHHGLEVLERRHDAWSRVLAVFRGVFAGIEHEDLRLPALGGSIFDPDKYPFLEGRATGTTWEETPAVPLPIDNRTVLMLLSALQVIEQTSGAQHLSYEALDVEQIGHVYEGLLERTAQRVPEATMGLTGTANFINPNVKLRELEEAAVVGDDELAALIVERTGRSLSAVKNASQNGVPKALQNRLLSACGADQDLSRRIQSFANHLRTDNWGDPLIYRKDAFVVTLGAGRRETGTHYTPKSLTEPIVQHALEPLVYFGPADGEPESKWKIKPSEHILALKVCDMAMGSGAFLVQACRWLGDRLLEAWNVEESGGRTISVEGVVLDQPGDAELLPHEKGERILIARRLIASRCLFGVDINPMAVELAKLGLWLVTMMRNRPFGFLDHALKCGDSLFGISQLQQLERFSLRDPDHDQPLLETAKLWKNFEDAAARRIELESIPNHTVAQIAEKARLHKEAGSELAKLQAAANFLVSAELDCPDGSGWITRRAVAASELHAAWTGELSKLQSISRSGISEWKPFHWPLEFPEVFADGGFDALITNPPFIGSKYWQERLPSGFRQWVQVLLAQKAGKADLAAVFFRRAYSLLRGRGIAGMIASATAREGDTLELGLAKIAEVGTIFRALSALEWPGKAGIHVCVAWFSKGPSKLVAILDGKTVEVIGPSLSEFTIHSELFRLKTAPWGFIGCDNGGGEILTLKSGDPWLKQLESANSPYLRVYLSGNDITAGRHKKPERWVIDCGVSQLSEVTSACRVTGEFLESFVKPARGPEDFKSHPGLIDRWWQMWNPRATQYERLRRQPSCLAIPVVAKFVSVVELPTDFTFTNKVCVIEKPPEEHHLVLLSSFFESWVIKNGGNCSGP